jgi:hypothetical protein
MACIAVGRHRRRRGAGRRYSCAAATYGMPGLCGVRARTQSFTRRIWSVPAIVAGTRPSKQRTENSLSSVAADLQQRASRHPRPCVDVSRTSSAANPGLGAPSVLETDARNHDEEALAVSRPASLSKNCVAIYLIPPPALQPRQHMHSSDPARRRVERLPVPRSIQHGAACLG